MCVWNYVCGVFFVCVEGVCLYGVCVVLCGFV